MNRCKETQHLLKTGEIVTNAKLSQMLQKSYVSKCSSSQHPRRNNVQGQQQIHTSSFLLIISHDAVNLSNTIAGWMWALPTKSATKTFLSKMDAMYKYVLICLTTNINMHIPITST